MLKRQEKKRNSPTQQSKLHKKSTRKTLTKTPKRAIRTAAVTSSTNSPLTSNTTLKSNSFTTPLASITTTARRHIQQSKQTGDNTTVTTTNNEIDANLTSSVQEDTNTNPITNSMITSKNKSKILPPGITITNDNFNSQSISNRDIHEIDPKPEAVTEPLLLDKIRYEAKIKNSRSFRFSEYIRDHQPQTRAALLAIPSIAVMWATHDFSMYLASLTDQLTQNAELTSNMLMGLGGIQALVGYGLFTNANKILSLAGQPSEPVIQEVIRRSLKNQQLHDELGGSFKIGHFVSVSTRSGGPRWTNNKARHYEEWLQHDSGKFTQPIPDIPLPNIMQNYLGLFPAFQSSAWNVAVAERVALDIRKNPQDYIDNDDGSESSSEEIDHSTSTDGTNDTTIAPTKTKKNNQTTTKDEQVLLAGETDSNITTTTASPETVHSVESQPMQLNEQALKLRKTRVSSYSGWERFWKPRRLQFTAHLIGPKDEGLLLCEVEKLNYGPSYKQSGGMTQYKVFQYVSLKDGKVTNIDQSERPSLLSHAHVQQLFDTIPVTHPVVSAASFDHILVEDKHKKDTQKYVIEEKKKVNVGIYH